MKEMKSNVFAFCLAASMLALTACSNEDSTEADKEATQTVRFSITEEDFGTDTELTRAGMQGIKPATAELSDCEVEVSAENEPAEKMASPTRAVTTPAHYTIRAYQSGALKCELKGTFSASSFTPDGGSPASIQLARNQTYDFVCFNDQVTPNGDKLEVSLADAATARIGHQQVTIGATDQTVSLSSKHAGVRMRTQFTAKKDIPTAISATLQSTGNDIPTRVSYNPATGTYTSLSSGAVAATTNNSPASAEAKFTASNYGQTYSYTSTGKYHYFLPTTDMSHFKLNVNGGTIFWKPLSGTINKLSGSSVQATANSTYLIKAKMKPQYTYLMSDGTTGFFKETTYGGGTKTPIAVVLDAGQRIAMALTDANAGGTLVWCTNAYWTTQTNVITQPAAQSLTTYARSGREETWNPIYSTGGIGVKAVNPIFASFHAAAHYNPGVVYTGSPALVWYLPSYHDWKLAFSVLGFGNASAVTNSGNYTWYGYLAGGSYIQVGGSGGDEWYWTSSAISISGSGTLGFFGNRMGWDSAAKSYYCAVRPFVAY